jgi:hypothetical protein
VYTPGGFSPVLDDGEEEPPVGLMMFGVLELQAMLVTSRLAEIVENNSRFMSILAFV